MLTKEEIFAVDDLPVLEVPTPEWGPGETVFVRSLAAEENEQCQNISKAPDSDRVFLGKFAALVLCTADGLRLFEDSDAEALGGKSLAVLGRIMEAAQEHNGMTESAREAVAKNSEPSQG